MEQLQVIQSKIYEIRGQKVMLDFDLAEMYQVETRVLNQAVKRNIERFPKDFMFQLTLEEWDSISSQFVMTSRMKRPKSAMPLAFTEHGVVMLSSVLRSDIAIQTSVLVVRAFVAMRQLITAAPQIDRVGQLEQQMKELKDYIEEVFADYTILMTIRGCSWNSLIKHWQNCKPRRNWKKNHAEESDLYSMMNKCLIAKYRISMSP